MMRAAVIASTPVFLLLLLVFVRPSLGWADMRFGFGMAAACSYGFMLIAGLPTHAILRWLGWQGWTHYVFGFLLALTAVMLTLTALEGTPPPPLPDDNSPFATFTLKGGGWLLVLALCSPLASVMASMFWRRAVKVDHGDW